MAVRLARSNTSTALTGSHPVPSVLPAADDGDSKGLKGAGAGGGGSAGSLAGTTHPLRIETPYYTATVPVWLDLIPDLVRETAGPESSSLVGSEGAEPTPPTVEHPADEWARTFLSPEAAEVREALGGVCVVFAFPSSSSSNRATGSRERQSTEALLGAVGRVVQQGLGGLDWDGVALAIGVGPGAGETGQLSDEEEAWIEDLCAEVLGGGVEFIHVRSLGAGFSASRKAGNASSSLEDSEGRNQYGGKPASDSSLCDGT